jgi:hypothetical protein
VRVSAILVVNDGPSSIGAVESTGSSRSSYAYADILGCSALNRIATRLRAAGIQSISMIGDAILPCLPSSQDVEITVADKLFERWLAAQRTLREHAARGIDTVFMVGVGAYVELDVIDALKFHVTRGTPLTQLENPAGPLDCWIVDTRWFCSAATGCSLPFRYGEFPGLPVPYLMDGYVNRLESPRDLRRLVMDMFLGRCEAKPCGLETKPGVWIDAGARVHRATRLVAPVYVGRSAVLRPSAVLTRFSNLERQSVVGEGTIVDRATILPRTIVGKGLNLSEAIADGANLTDLSRNVTVQVNDRSLLAATHPGDRTFRSHRKFSVESGRKRSRALEYSEYLSRAAGRLSEVFFRG